MKFPLYIAKRYLFSKSNNNAINFITLIAGFGIIIGTAALFIVLSGFSGLKNFSLEFTSFSDPDLKIVPKTSKTFQFTPAHKKALRALNSIAYYTEVVEERMLMSCENKHLAVTLKGVDANFPNATIDSILVYGQWFEPNTPQMVAGWGVTNELGFGIFDVTNSLNSMHPSQELDSLPPLRVPLQV